MSDTKLAPLELPGDEYVWGKQVLMALDCLLNTVFRGWYHETLSSRSWRAFNEGKKFGQIFMPKIDWLFSWQEHPEGHCRHVFERDLQRARLVVKEKKL